MTSQLMQKYRAKAKDSFKTKKALFLFDSALNDKHQVEEADFVSFEIMEELVKAYTSEYWQQPLDYEIKGKPVSEIERLFNLIEKENLDTFLQLEKDYILSFENIFPATSFEKLLSEKNCHYCKISKDEIEELGKKNLLYKKTLRGWNLEIDRLNSNLEYFPENCVMSCYWCNNAKTDEFTESEFLKIGSVINAIWNDRLR